MSIAELKKQADANRIIKNELMKLKISAVSNPELQPDLLVDANLQLDDLNEAKILLRKNLSSVMPIEKIDEIVNDASLVDDSNIQLINEKWKEFSRQLKDGPRLSFDRFKEVFGTFVDNITNPMNEQQLNKLQYIEQALRDIAMEQSNYAPKIQNIIDSLDSHNMTINSIDNILDVVNGDEIDLNDIENIIKKDDSSPPKSFEDFPSWTLDNIKVDSDKIVADYGRDYEKKITPLKEKLKKNLINSPPEDVRVAIYRLKEAEINAYNQLLSDLQKPRERKQLPKILEVLNPLVKEYRNSKMREYMIAGVSPEEAKSKTLTDSKDMFGYGLKNNNTPKGKIIDFGCLNLNIDKLKNENKLKLTYKNGNALKEIKLTSVSDKYIDMVMDIVQGKKFNERKFNSLSEDEKYLYQVMLKKAKLAGDVDVRLDQLNSSTIDKLKNEWEVTFGEINSGNNSKALIKRAKELINIFIDKRMISKSEGLKILTNL